LWRAREVSLKAKVYCLSDPTGDTLALLGFVNAASEVHTSTGLVGRVTAAGDVLNAAGEPIGRVTEAGAIYRLATGAPSAEPVGHVARDGSVYRGAALSPQAVAGYIEPGVARPSMGGAALLLGLCD
jgi:hypothetical protein